jgi:uncharacterized RDD family membrane protein YckC
MLHEVITSEKVPFTYRVAGLGSRFLAALVDMALWLVLLLMGVLAAGVLEAGRAGLGMALLLLWLFTLLFGYFLLFEWLWLGQTPGKRLLGIRVIQWQGTSISFAQAALRNLVRLIDVLPAAYGVGFLVAACNREQRRLGDLAAGTLVVHQELAAGAVRVLYGHALSGAEQAREALLRQRAEQLDRRQKQLLVEVCLRRDQLRIRSRSRLFSTLADYFRRQMGVAPAEYESDEKFILHLAAALGGGGKAGEAVVAALRPAAAAGAGPSLRNGE